MNASLTTSCGQPAASAAAEAQATWRRSWPRLSASAAPVRQGGSAVPPVSSAILPTRPTRPRYLRMRSGQAGYGLGQSALGRIPPHGTAARSGLDIVSAHRNGLWPPCAACPGPGIEKSYIRFDDSLRIHRSGVHEPEQSTIHPDTRSIGTSVEPLRSDSRPNVPTSPTLRPGHRVGTVRSRSRLSPNKEAGASETLMRIRTATPSRGETLPRRYGDLRR